MRKFLKNNSRKIVKNVTKELMKHIGSITSVIVTNALDIALTLFATSMGELIAFALDYIDPWIKKSYKRNNGYIFN